jgi:aminopeptidase N
MKISTFLLLIISYHLIANEISLPLEYKGQDFDIQHYSVYSDFSEGEKYVSGYSEIRLDWKHTEKNRTFYFHSEGLTIDSVIYDGRFYSGYVRIDNYFMVRDTNNFDSRSSDIRIYFHGNMTSEGGNFDWGGVHYESDILYHLGVAFRDSAVSQTRRWFPCYDHPSDKATFDFTFVTDSNKTVASNGNLDTTYINDENYKITKYSSEFPIATYLMTFALSDYILLDLSTEEMPVHIYTKKADSAASAYAYQNVPKMLEAFEYYYADYPFEKVGYVNTVKGAMEHQTMISMPRSVVYSAYNSQEPHNTTIAHELSHMWFGDCVSPRDFRDAWFNESFATFSESLYLEYINGKDAYITNQYHKMMRYVNIISKNEGLLPLYDFPREEPSSNYPQTIYQKGAVVLGMVRYKIGDERFFNTLKDIMQQYRYKNITTHHLIGELSRAAENIEENADFLEQWIYYDNFPELNISIEQNENNIRIITEQIQEGNIFNNFPLEINFLNGDESESHIIDILAEKDTFYLENIIFDEVEVNKGPNLISLVKVNNLNIETSVKDVSASEIIIHPNPAEDYIEITINKPSCPDFIGAEGSDIEIYNVLGEKIMSKSIHPMTPSHRMNVANLPRGVYFVKFGNQVEKFVKR